jgi:hypothetical protein
MIPYFLLFVADTSQPIDQTWMLGVTVGIIAVLFVLLVRFLTERFTRLETKMEEITNKVYDHDMDIKLIKAGHHNKEWAEQVITQLRAMGSGGFDHRDFQKK